MIDQTAWSPTVAERLWARTQRDDVTGCLIWQGYVHPTRGYGQIGLGGRDAGIGETHRVAWVVTYGAIPLGMFICHRCDRPPCIEPTHLFLGTPADNARDMAEKGRGRGAEGQRNANARLTSEQVAEIRTRYVPQRWSRQSNTSELAAEFGITSQYVSQIARGIWRKQS